jgi:hypothetical protein
MKTNIISYCRLRTVVSRFSPSSHLGLRIEFAYLCLVRYQVDINCCLWIALALELPPHSIFVRFEL